MCTSILDNIKKHINLDDNEKTIFLDFLESKSLKRREFILTEGNVSKKMIFVVNGCLRIYTIDEIGNEHILSFAPENWWCGDLNSFIGHKKSKLFIDALVATEIIQIDRKNIDILYQKVPKFERFFRILFQNAYIIQQNRINANLSLNATNRYKKFLKTHPGLQNTIAQKYIASYIGVTPEFFSEIKSKAINLKS